MIQGNVICPRSCGISQNAKQTDVVPARMFHRYVQETGDGAAYGLATNPQRKTTHVNRFYLYYSKRDGGRECDIYIEYLPSPSTYALLRLPTPSLRQAMFVARFLR